LKRSKINPVSKKRIILNRKRSQFVNELLKFRLMCEARIRGCTMTPTEVHEILTRGRGGSIIDPENCLALCRSCHFFITNEPSWSKQNGFVVSWSVTVEADLAAAKRARMQFVFGDMELEEDFEIGVEWDDSIDWPDDDN
jgi:hypothetical protein